VVFGLNFAPNGPMEIGQDGNGRKGEVDGVIHL
jgi:hypothetical protein